MAIAELSMSPSLMAQLQDLEHQPQSETGRAVPRSSLEDKVEAEVAVHAGTQNNWRGSVCSEANFKEPGNLSASQSAVPWNRSLTRTC